MAVPLWLAGLDVGQLHDPSALAITQVELVQSGDLQMRRYLARHLERFPLGTPYPTLVRLVAQRLALLPMAHRPLGPQAPWGRPYRLILDATGVGRPVLDMFRAAGLQPVAVTLSHGERVTAHAWDDFTVPKRVLMGALQVTLQTERFRVARALPEAQTLVQEAMQFQYKISAEGTDQYGAWREGQHDDLLFAAALCAWYGERFGLVRTLTEPQQARALGPGNPLERLLRQPLYAEETPWPR